MDVDDMDTGKLLYLDVVEFPHVVLNEMRRGRHRHSRSSSISAYYVTENTAAIGHRALLDCCPPARYIHIE